MSTTISPKMARALTTAIVRRARKHYPNAGIVGCYGFGGHTYPNKRELRTAVLEFCEGLTYDQVEAVQRNFIRDMTQVPVVPPEQVA